MESQAMFLNCPAYLDNDGATRCGLPAEVEVRYIMDSTDGPVESAKIMCPLGHWFNGLIEYLTVPQPPTVAAVSSSFLPSPAVRTTAPLSRALRGETHEPLVRARPVGRVVSSGRQASHDRCFGAKTIAVQLQHRRRSNGLPYRNGPETVDVRCC